MAKRLAHPLPTQAYLKSVLIYDPETGIFIWRWRDALPLNWNRRRAGCVAGSRDKRGYVLLGLDGRVYPAHRLAWVYEHGDVLGRTDDVDHKEDPKWDNRICNLRPATASQNLGNRKRSRGKLLPKGVYAERHRFRAILRHNGRSNSLGTYGTIEEAHAAYRAKASLVFGEFARFD